MPEQPEPKGWTPIEDSQNAAAFLVLAAQSLAAPVEVFLRTRFGRRYFGVPAAIGLFAVPMWMMFWPGEDATPIFTFWVLFLVIQGRARIESILMSSRGDLVHSRYNGRPRLQRFFRRAGERRVKAVHEPLLVIGTGVLMLGVSEPLGSYLITAGICLALVASVIEGVERNRLMSMHDAWLEQQYHAERFRDITGR